MYRYREHCIQQIKKTHSMFSSTHRTFTKKVPCIDRPQSKFQKIFQNPNNGSYFLTIMQYQKLHNIDYHAILEINGKVVAS